MERIKQAYTSTCEFFARLGMRIWDIAGDSRTQLVVGAIAVDSTARRFAEGRYMMALFNLAIGLYLAVPAWRALSNKPSAVQPEVHP